MSDRNSRELFGQRTRCKALADKYVKEHVSPYNMVVVDRIDFSHSRSSCIASTDEQLGPIQKTSPDWTYKVVDLLTGEDLAWVPCSGETECAQSRQKRDEAFDKAH